MPQTDFEGLLHALVEGDVEFMVVGGVAAIAHGSARLTQDLGVVYERSDDNVQRIVAAIRDFEPYLRGAPPGLPFEWSERTVRNGLNFTLTTRLGDIDLLGEVTGGGDYRSLLPHTIVLQLFELECRFLDLEWLIRTKRAAGRPKDLEAIAELEALLEESG